MKEQINAFKNILKAVVVFSLCFYGLHTIIETIAGAEWAAINVRLITTICMAIAAVGLFIVLDKKDLFEEKKLSFWKLALTVVVGAVTSLGFNKLISFIPWRKIPIEGASVDIEVMFAIPLWLVMIAFSIVTPICEELLFRGGIYSNLKKVMPVPVAIIMTSAIFGIYHGNLQQGLYAFVMSILITLFYEKGKNIIYPIVFHASANLIVSIIHAIW